MSAKFEYSVRAIEENGRSLSQLRDRKFPRVQGTAAGPAIVPLPRIKPRQPAVDLIRSALRGATARLEAADPEARRGDVEGIHRLRTSTRRLRSELQAVRGLVERDWRERLERELKWLARVLGDVRDLDILTSRLQSAAGPPEGHGRTGPGERSAERSPLGTLAPLFLELRERHARNSQALREALQSERYRNLVATIQTSTAVPAVREDAWEPCRTALPPLVQESWRRLKSGGRDLGSDSPDADFHEVRKSAKRARYTAELIAPALGQRTAQRAKRFIRLSTKVQDVLGEHQDAVVAAAEIERFLAGHRGDPCLARAAEDLLETQHQAARAARRKFFDVWKKLDRGKSSRWFKPE